MRPANVGSPLNSRVSGTDEKTLKKRYNLRGSVPPRRAPHLAEIHRAQQAAKDADLTANDAPLADSSEEEEGEEGPEA